MLWRLVGGLRHAAPALSVLKGHVDRFSRATDGHTNYVLARRVPQRIFDSEHQPAEDDCSVIRESIMLLGKLIRIRYESREVTLAYLKG
jgi:hypothetical protein